MQRIPGGLNPDKWEGTCDAKLALWKLNRSCVNVPIIKHFESAEPIILETNHSSLAIARIINQYNGFRAVRQVIFYSWKCLSTNLKYDTYDRKLFVIIESMKK